MSSIVSQAMTGDNVSNLETLSRSYGFRWSQSLHRAIPPDVENLDAYLNDTMRLSDAVFQIFDVLMLGHKSESLGYYENLVTSQRRPEYQRLALEILAWSSIAQARLWRAAHLTADPLYFRAPFDVVPRMDQPGWYPNPLRIGDIVGGEATFQRFWDGGWTDQIRAKQGKSYTVMAGALDDPPQP